MVSLHRTTRRQRHSRHSIDRTAEHPYRAISHPTEPERNARPRYRGLGRMVQFRDGASRRGSGRCRFGPPGNFFRSEEAAQFESRIPCRRHLLPDAARHRLLRYRPVFRRSISPEASVAGAGTGLRARYWHGVYRNPGDRRSSTSGRHPAARILRDHRTRRPVRQLVRPEYRMLAGVYANSRFRERKIVRRARLPRAGGRLSQVAPAAAIRRGPAPGLRRKYMDARSHLSQRSRSLLHHLVHQFSNRPDLRQRIRTGRSLCRAAGRRPELCRYRMAGQLQIAAGTFKGMVGRPGRNRRRKLEQRGPGAGRPFANRTQSDSAHFRFSAHRGVTDGRTYEPNRVNTGADSCLSVWTGGLGEDVHDFEISVRLDGTDLPATYLSGVDEKGWRQINALLPPKMEPGQYFVSVQCRGTESKSVPVELLA